MWEPDRRLREGNTQDSEGVSTATGMTRNSRNAIYEFKTIDSSESI